MQSAPLPENRTSLKALGDKLASLEHPPAPRQSLPESTRRSSRFILDSNPAGITALAFDFSEAECTLTASFADREQQVQCGSGAWVYGMTHLEGPQPQRTAACGAWLTPDTYEITLRFYETPFTRSLACQFTDCAVQVKMRTNVSFGPKDGPVLLGKLLEN
jgi:hypothetical protein